ncbi:hypothetical protein O181_011999 [Austropuccinia psidii MF-1]|uniref:Tf2-1-like SH3-like domain-containing protein n=1 Tax=Austropuccinia psidii MF-1 TaxID=1389203 RepID=A0A9Q3GMF0_9BASI|nr:hypothetical protein [Austropuccinia psidii MF-1]
MEPDFKRADQVLVSTLNFNNLKGPEKMRDSFLGPFTIIKLIEKNEVEVKLTEELSRKHPVFPFSLVEQYFKERRLVRFRNQTEDKDKWLAEDAIPEGNLHLRRFRTSRRTEGSHQ